MFAGDDLEMSAEVSGALGKPADLVRSDTALIDDPIIGQAIVAMTWAVLDVASASHALLTSDRPYITTHGLLHPSCLLRVPISPLRMFIAANDASQLHRMARQSASESVRQENDQVVRMAVRNVYGNSGGQLAFVDRRLSRADEPSVSGIITR